MAGTILHSQWGDAALAIRGAVLGFSIAAPVGPIGLLCIRRSLAQGRAAGFVTGLGAATADAAYGAVAAFGLTFVSSFLQRQQFWLALVGGIFLCYLGVKTFLTQPAEQAAAAGGRRLVGAYLSTVGLTLANPATILSFIGLFAGFGVGASSGYGAATVLVLGVFLGSACWWLLLSSAVGLARARVEGTWMVWVNRLSGGLLFGFGVFALSKLAGGVG